MIVLGIRPFAFFGYFSYFNPRYANIQCHGEPRTDD